MKALINARIYDFENYIENGYVVYSDKIVEVGRMANFNETRYDTFDCEGAILMPSLVCGHTHIYSTFARGLKLPLNPHNFQEILDQLWWKIDREIDNEIAFASGIVSGIEHLKNGVTTIFDHHASGAEISGSLDTLKQAIVDTIGMRGVFAFETSDRFDVSTAIEENMRFIDLNNTNFTSGLFGMHASLSLSDETLIEVKQSFKNNPIHIHVAESVMDEDDSVSKHGMRVMERLNKFGLLSPDSIYVHGIHMNDLELDLIKKTGGVVCLNVSSNMNNGVGLPDYQKLKAKGIPVIIGNDGLNPSMTNEYMTLFYASHLASESLMGFSLADLADVIDETYKYASKRLGIKLGRLLPGYAADLIVIPYTPPTPMDKTNALAHLFYGLFSAFKPRHVYVAGRPLVFNYQVESNLQKAYVSSFSQAKRLWQKLTAKEDN